MIKLLKKMFCCNCVYCILWDEFSDKENFNINSYKKREKELLSKS